MASKTPYRILMFVLIIPLLGAASELPVGEKLTFALNYGFLNAGSSVMEVSGITETKGHITYQLQSRTQSNSFVDAFYKVRDKITSWIDTSTFATIRFEKSLHEGDYRKEYSVWFDYTSMLAYSGSDTTRIEHQMRDVLSLFYYIRSLTLDVGDTIRMHNFDNDKISPFFLRVMDREKIKVPAGEYMCLVLEPYMKSDFLFKYEGRLQIWITDDRRKIPVLMKSKATIGSMILKLTDYKPG